MPETAVDHDARHLAALAVQSVEDHKVYCDDRWREARKSLEAASAAIGRLHGRIDRLIVATGGAALMAAAAAAASVASMAFK